MSQRATGRQDPMRTATAVLAVALVVMAALIAYLVWGRPAPTVTPAPTPTSSTSATTATSATPASPTSVAPAPATSSAAPTVTSAEPEASPSATSTSPAPATTMMWQGKASFEHFTVEVLQDEADVQLPEIEGKAALLVEVCATRAVDGAEKVRISSEPWTLEDSTGLIQQPQQGGYQPAFPAAQEVAVGDCVRGYLTFDYTTADSDYASLVYENGLGDRAVWQFH